MRDGNAGERSQRRTHAPDHPSGRCVANRPISAEIGRNYFRPSASAFPRQGSTRRGSGSERRVVVAGWSAPPFLALRPAASGCCARAAIGAGAPCTWPLALVWHVVRDGQSQKVQKANHRTPTRSGKGLRRLRIAISTNLVGLAPLRALRRSDSDHMRGGVAHGNTAAALRDMTASEPSAFSRRTRSARNRNRVNGEARFRSDVARSRQPDFKDGIRTARRPSETGYSIAAVTR
jgi:hypothetical protein